MKVYVLIGKSGSGKSFQAINLCKERKIEAIIDDGLFIFNGEVKAGKSAKREATTIGAIKTAIFNQEEHRRSVARKIAQQKPKSILVLGTSIAMVEKIAERLEIMPIDEYVYIENITTEGEREIAKSQRNDHGKHVVPVPVMELKRQFSGYFVHPLRIFKGWSADRGGFTEKTEVRPTYSYMGDFTISDKIFRDIVRCISTEVDGILGVLKVEAETTRTGMIITILLSIEMNHITLEGLASLQKKAFITIEAMTAFNIEEVNIEVRDIA